MNVVFKYLGAGVMLSIAGGCQPSPKSASSSAAPQAPQPLSDADRAEIAEVVLRHAFRLGPQRGLPHVDFGSYCISVLGDDPDPLFLGRFAASKPVVRPLSACPEDTGRRRDPEKKPAAMFQVQSIESLSSDTVQAEMWWSGGYWPSGQGYKFELRRVAGPWSITAGRMHSVE